MTTIITPPPSVVAYSATPVGSQKQTRTPDLKTEVVQAAVPKDLRVQQGKEKPRGDFPETYRRTGADGTDRLVMLNEEGVKSETRIPTPSQKIQLLTDIKASPKLDQIA